MTFSRLAAPLLGAAVILSACGSLDDYSVARFDLVREGVPTGTLVFRNRASDPLLDLRIRPSVQGRQIGEGNYGDNLLGREGVPSGGEVSFEASEGCYQYISLTGGASFFASATEKFGVVCLREGVVDGVATITD